MHHFKWHEGVLASIKDRLAYYRGDDPNKPRFAWYSDSEKLMAGIGETGRVDIKKTKCKKSQPGAMVRGRNRMRRRARALLQDAAEVKAIIAEEEKELEEKEDKLDVAETVLEVLEEQEEERKVPEEATEEVKKRRARALLQDAAEVKAIIAEEEKELEEKEDKLDVAETVLEVLEEQEEERKVPEDA